MRPGWLLLLVLPVLSGCVTPPPQVHPDVIPEVPAEWSSPAEVEGEVDGEWWKTFGDPRLDRLVEIALVENQDLRAAAARVERAAAEARIAGADLKPNIGIGLQAARGKQNFIGLPLPGSDEVLSTTTSNFGVSVDISWEVDLWGRIRAGARAAVADFEAVRADLRGARQSIAAQTAKAWFAVLEAQAQVDLAQERSDSFRKNTGQVRTRYELGLRPPLDLRLALSNQASADALLELRRNQFNAVTRQLEVLLGRYPSGRIVEEFPPGELPERPAPIPMGVPAEIVSRRPDVVAAERRLAAFEQRTKQARKALYPRLTLTASGGTATAALGDLLDGNFGVWSLIAGLTQPIFQGGRLRAGVARADASWEESLAYYARGLLFAYSEVEIALAAEEFLARRELDLAEAALQLNAAERLADQRYRQGLGGYLVVLDSQTRALLAESEHLSVRRELLSNRIDLHLALGGGFEFEEISTVEDGES